MRIAQELDGPLVKRQMRAHLQIQMEYLNVFPKEIYVKDKYQLLQRKPQLREIV